MKYLLVFSILICSFLYSQTKKSTDSLPILNQENVRLNDYDKIKYDEQLNAIAVLSLENEQQEYANKYSKLISILAIALISILSLLSLSLYKNNIIRTQSNLVLEEKNKELQIEKDKVEKASKARSEFLSTVSHELRTPLNAINGITHLLLEENPKPSQMEYLTSLEFSGKYLLTFINEMLEINRIESNTIEAEKIGFNLKKLVDNIKNSLKEIATTNNNSLNIDIDSKIPDNLIGDPIKISQIFMNLIYNALKFTKNGDVTVLVKQTATHENKTSVYFEIKDTGIGIEEGKQDTIFDSFSQGSVEINRKYGGTGLGLTIVKKLVAILGGEIKLKSVLGQGSVFSFNLEFEVDYSKPMPIIIKPKYNEKLLINKKVLLVEDNKINQMITKKMLENKKISCEIIGNGEDAVEVAKKNSFDLILMDVHLPGINGTIATQQIRKFDSTTPIIAITAISLEENREMLMSFGMNDVITKPFAPEDFYSVISKYI
ncbi:response regulator [Flavobacterium sp.]|uniref:response regulator n=1 Tax=Flavobacterium sp. TaxID=239 RepID=UPI00286D488C|nr:response regulator [Flavobacterium sp.]